MNARMFIYIYGNDMNRTIARHFGVRKVCLPKVRITVPSEGVLKANQLGAYCEGLNLIFINESLWNISSEYDKHGLFIHEIIHAYQHKHKLCDFDYDVPYAERPQEIHCHENVDMILSTLKIPMEDSILDSLFEEAMA